MLEYNRIDIGDTRKIGNSCECSVCYYCWFSKIDFTSQPCVCDGCYNLMENLRASIMLQLLLLGKK